MKQYHINVGGMCCEHCVRMLTGALNGIAGVAGFRLLESPSSQQG